VSAEVISADDLAALRDSVVDLIARGGGSTAVRAAIAAPQRTDGQLWAGLTEIGAAALAVPEELGGAGAGWGSLSAVVEEVGAALAPVPLLSSAVMATGALMMAANNSSTVPAELGDLVEALASGERTATLCLAGETSWDTPGVSADGGLLTGTAHYVTDAEAATDLVVLAGPGPHATVHVIAADSPGVEVVPVATMDPTRPLSRVRFTEAAAEAFPAPADLLPRLRDLVWALLAVEQVGAAAAALRLTVEYTKTRKQFGRVIGSFQALKHRMADMYADVETARSIAYAAVDAIDTPAGAELAAAAHVHCSEAFSHIVAEAVQLHGGIGITWEHDIQLYFKRAHGSAQFFGQPVDVVAGTPL